MSKSRGLSVWLTALLNVPFHVQTVFTADAVGPGSAIHYEHWCSDGRYALLVL